MDRIVVVAERCTLEGLVINSENNSNRGVTWALVLAATIYFAPVLYVISSGPMKIGFEKLGRTSETYDRVFAPLVWLNENTPVSGALTWYWGLFPTNAKQELDVDPMGEWLYSPEARAIKRNLGVADGTQSRHSMEKSSCP